MGVVEGMRTNKKLWTCVAIGLILAAIVLMSYQFWPEKHYSQSQAYFSDDDGKTWYSDDINHIPPYPHDGKEGVRAVIYSYANGSKTFCGFLMRFPAPVKKAIDAAVAAGASKSPPDTPATIAYGINFGPQVEVKRPNTSGPWAAMSSKEGRAATDIAAPDGSTLDTVVP